MRLYLDEDSASPLLARLLANAGHDVQVPAEVQLGGETDPAQLTHAIRQQRVLLTSNYDDFEELHDLILAAAGHHPGVLVVRQDNDPTRDMTERAIVRAIGNLERSGSAPADSFVILNQWR